MVAGLEWTLTLLGRWKGLYSRCGGSEVQSKCYGEDSAGQRALRANMGQSRQSERGAVLSWHARACSAAVRVSGGRGVAGRVLARIPHRAARAGSGRVAVGCPVLHRFGG